MSKHTPGPWFVERYDDGSMAVAPREGFLVCTMGVVPPERIEANAQLIAAAPHLMNACRLAVAFISAYRNRTMTGAPVNLPSDYEAVSALREALALAGEIYL